MTKETREIRPVGDQHRSATTPKEGQRSVVPDTRLPNHGEGTRPVLAGYSDLEGCHVSGVRSITKAGKPCKGKVIEAGHCFAH